jgi:NAD(P)-dependent dehydrogenase (short-subunit alcohol dehydrogenase family)
MCNLLFTYELARRLRRLEGTHVTANAIHPGLVKSGIMREAAAPIRWFPYIISTTPQKASATPVYYALSPEVEGMTGLFFKGKQTIDSNPYSKNQEVQKHLWEVSIALTGLG